MMTNVVWWAKGVVFYKLGSVFVGTWSWHGQKRKEVGKQVNPVYSKIVRIQSMVRR